MNPATIAAKAASTTVQQVGRRLSSSYANNSRNGIGRVVCGSVGSSVPSTPSQELKQTRLVTTGTTALAQLTQQVLAAQRRTKSSMAAEINRSEEEPMATSTTTANANATYDQSVREPFPSIVLGPERSVEPQGSFAEAQAQVR